MRVTFQGNNFHHNTSVQGESLLGSSQADQHLMEFDSLKAQSRDQMYVQCKEPVTSLFVSSKPLRMLADIKEEKELQTHPDQDNSLLLKQKKRGSSYSPSKKQ
jgi:hypothetical protein